MPTIFLKHRSRLAVTRRIVAMLATVAATAFAPSAARAQSWSGVLSGLNEVPANASAATGFASLSLSGSTLSLSLSWSGLSGQVTAGHIHCCTSPGSNIGVAVGFPGLSSGTSGSYSAMFDLNLQSTYNSSFLANFGGGTAAGAELALINGLNAGNAYVNLHNAQFPGGEIRANLTATPVTVVTPEPASVAMLAVGLIAMGAAVRTKRRVK